MDKHKPLAEITRYFDNITYINHWWMKLRDFIFAHPSRYSKITLRTVENAVKYFIKNKIDKEFGFFEGVGIGHTHRIGSGEAFGRYAYEFGCIINKNVDYRHRNAKSNKWEYGYGIVTFNNCKMDYNKTKDFKID
jgi:hypothetical protein